MVFLIFRHICVYKYIYNVTVLDVHVKSGDVSNNEVYICRNNPCEQEAPVSDCSEQSSPMFPTFFSIFSLSQCWISLCGHLLYAQHASSLLCSTNVMVFFHCVMGSHNEPGLHHTAQQSKVSSLPVGGVLVVCSSFSNIIITMAVSACTIPPCIILTHF